MFTGIIEATAEILETSNAGLVLVRPQQFDDIAIGSSIAVHGVCLSVTAFTNVSMQFDVVQETWSKTNLSLLKVEDSMNLERAMPANGRFDGHVVQGHSEGVGVVRSITSSPQPPPPGEEGESEDMKRVLWKTGLARNTRFFAKEMRKEPTEAEAKLWEYLRKDQLGTRFRRQYVVSGRILDFYCPQFRLAVEVDGPIHRKSEIEKDDGERDEYLEEEFGIVTLRCTNDEVLHSPEEVVQAIESVLDKRKQATHPPPPLEEGLGEEVQNNVQTSNIYVAIQIPTNLLPFVVPKGSITLNGVSLTVADLQDDICTVALIPHTLEHTTFGSIKEGDRINIETDVLGRYVLHQMQWGM